MVSVHGRGAPGPGDAVVFVQSFLVQDPQFSTAVEGAALRRAIVRLRARLPEALRGQPAVQLWRLADEIAPHGHGPALAQVLVVDVAADKIGMAVYLDLQ